MDVKIAENTARLLQHAARYRVMLSVHGYVPPSDLTARLATVAMVAPESADGIAEAFRDVIALGTPQGRFQAAAQARAAQDGIAVTEAFHLVARERPELYWASIGRR